MRQHGLVWIGALVVSLGGGVLLLPAHGQQQQPLFGAATELVDLYVTVTDRGGRLVPNLLQDDFTVFDEGQPKPLAVFDNGVRPITVVVMLDTSMSMSPTLDLLYAAAEQFLIRLLPDDRGRVGAFNDKIQIDPPAFTGDRDVLIDTLDGLYVGNPTRLWDALNASLDALVGVEGRRVIVVFTDGDDTSSGSRSGDVLERAMADEVMIYAIGLESNFFNGVRQVRTRPDRSLRRFAEETGGGYFELKETDELGPTFTRVAQELHSQYVLGFEPATDGRVHRVEVRVRGDGMTARARRSYVAASDAPAEGAGNR